MYGDITVDEMNRNLNDKYHNTVVRFFEKEEWIVRKGEKPFKKTFLMIEKTPIGNISAKHASPATEDDKDRFRRQYELFLNGQEERQTGFSLERWGKIPMDLIVMFNSSKIFTLEQLSNVSDNNLERMGPGIVKWKYAAAEALKDGQPQMDKLEEENKELKERLEALEKKLSATEKDDKDGDSTTDSTGCI
jgi:hypothetical protein